MQQKKEKTPYNVLNQDYILRVALYCRVSKDEQVLNGYSLQTQEDALVAFAKENGYKIVKIYRDEGNSARQPILKRKVVLDLLEDVKGGKIDRILFTKLDRWTRNVGQFHSAQAILDKHNVTWEAIMENYSTVSADQRLRLNIMLSVAENESDRLSERVKVVFDNFIQKKEVPFPDLVAPYGYRVVDKHLVKDPETIEIVEHFFRFLETSSIRQAGISCNEKYGLSRGYNQWLNMTKKTVYYGVYRDVPDFCEPYITKEFFDRVNHNPAFARRAKNNRTYLFSGMVRCARCGRRTAGRYCTSASSKRKKYNYYRCPQMVLDICGNVTQMPELKLEAYLLEHVREEIENQILEYEVAMATPNAKKKKTDVNKLQERLRRVTVSYHAGNLSDDEYLEESARIKDLIAEAQAKNEDDPDHVNVDALREFLSTDFESLYDTFTPEERRRLWASIIEDIYVDGAEVVRIKFRP